MTPWTSRYANFRQFQEGAYLVSWNSDVCLQEDARNVVELQSSIVYSVLYGHRRTVSKTKLYDDILWFGVFLETNKKISLDLGTQ